jgi:predicted  nucleic acid-binding Zn-ribbon protein
VEEAHAAAERATANAVVARRRREDLESELAAVRQRLADLEVQVTAISDTEDAARRAQLTAARAERAAIESAARARASLQALVTASGGAAP